MVADLSEQLTSLCCSISVAKSDDSVPTLLTELKTQHLISNITYGLFDFSKACYWRQTTKENITTSTHSHVSK
jgi:hypothetical protein